MGTRAKVAVCGAGIAGISLAYHLAVSHGTKDVLLVDERPPLSLTSDKSTECYRNWWPGPGNAMVAFMNRSIDLLEQLANQTGNVFHLNRRGYLYLTADSEKKSEIEKDALHVSALGGGPLRIHRGRPGDPVYQPPDGDGYSAQLTGADLFLEPTLIRQHFPYLSKKTVAGLHVRRAGWFSAQQLGMYLLEQARNRGVRMIQARIDSVKVLSGKANAIHLDSGDTIECQHFVNAAGPYLKQVGEMLGVDIPVFSELHLKVAFKDHLGILPRDAPLLIWTDPQQLEWDPEEQEFLSTDPGSRWLLAEFPPGVHTRPEGPPGSPMILMLWEYHTGKVEPVFPPPLDASYPEIALRGLTKMIPGLRNYFGRAPRPIIDGGYYTKTRENRPLIGPLPIEGGWVIGALSGYGLMAALAAGELLAAHIAGTKLPAYAPAFGLERYQDPADLKLMERWGDSGQL